MTITLEPLLHTKQQPQQD